MSNPGEVIFSDAEAWRLQLEREHSDAAVSIYAPKLAGPNPAITEIYKRILEAEEEIAPDGDYEVGSAKVDDDLLIMHGLCQVLLTAEHATIQKRQLTDRLWVKDADMGIGGLAKVVAEVTQSAAIVAIGRQTGDANFDPEHPLKTAMKEVIEHPQNRAHLSLHMLDRGRVVHPHEVQGDYIQLGIGNKPSEATLELKDRLVEIAGDLELKIGVNAPHINFDNEHRLVRDEEGEVKTITFDGTGKGTTRTFSAKLAKKLGKRDDFAAVQIEINEVLLVKQNDEVAFPTQADRKLGTYLGYEFVKRAAQGVARL